MYSKMHGFKVAPSSFATHCCDSSSPSGVMMIISPGCVGVRWWVVFGFGFWFWGEEERECVCVYWFR